MSAPPDWQQPVSMEFFKPAEHKGELLDVTYQRYLAGYRMERTKPGDEGGAECSIIILDGPNAGSRYEDVILNQKALRGALKAMQQGQHMLTRISQGEGSAGKSGTFLFDTYTDDDVRIARAFYAEQSMSKLPPTSDEQRSPATPQNGNVPPRQHDYRDDPLHKQASEYKPPQPPPTPPGMSEDDAAAFRAWQESQRKRTDDDPPF